MNHTRILDGKNIHTGAENNLRIYILELEDEFWYVGRTYDIKKRILEHSEGRGCSWTRLHKPIRCKGVVKDVSTYDELKYTLMYMEQYGIDKVRGSVYCKIELDENEKKEIERHIRAARNECYNCGFSGHYIANCKKLEESTIRDNMDSVVMSMKICCIKREPIAKVRVMDRKGVVSYQTMDDYNSYKGIIGFRQEIDVYLVVSDVWLDLGEKGYIKMFDGDSVVVDQVSGEQISPFL